MVTTKFRELVKMYVATTIEFPRLKAVTLAQWLHETGKGTADLFLVHNNAAGLKWRVEMVPFGEAVSYKAHDGVDTYTKFKSLDAFIAGYWKFIDRAPYAGWRDHVANPEDYIKHLKACKYAGDPNYVAGVMKHLDEAKALIREFEAQAKQDDHGVDEIEANCTDKGEPALTAYAKGVAKFTRILPKDGNRVQVEEFLKAFPNAKLSVPDTSKKIIPKMPDLGEKPPAKKSGKRVCVEPGHSEQRVGARGKNGVEEENLNRLGAQIIKARLEAEGHEVTYYDPLIDNLTDIGRKARGHDLFISVHHNAFDADGIDEYSCVMTHASKRRPADNQFASLAAKKICDAIGARIFQKAGELPGVYPAGLSVLSAAIDTGCPVCVLAELYFCDDYSSVKVAEERTSKSAHGVAEAAIQWLENH